MATATQGTSRAEPRAAWRTHAGESLRTLSAVTLAGVLSGLVVGGVGGRLAMMLLARLNPSAAGLVSDDGFVIGRLTLDGTLSLLVITTAIGLLGAGAYAVLRGLAVGPRWFRVVSLSVGPAVVVGELLVHPGGVDFVVLQPAALSIALFVAIPGLYAAALTLLAEFWLRPGGLFRRARLPSACAPLLLWGAGFFLLPVLLGLVLLWGVRELLRRSERGREVLGPGARWAARGLLALVFCASSARLIAETVALV